MFISVTSWGIAGYKIGMFCFLLCDRKYQREEINELDDNSATYAPGK